MKTYAKLVFVDSGKSGSLPSEVNAALSAAGGHMPRLVFMSPDHKKTYASFNHGSLKGQDYGKIFRDVKKSIRDAKKTGELKRSGIDGKSLDPIEDNDVAESGPVIIKDPKVLSWMSTVGSEIEAKLIKFENNTYYLRVASGKTIPVKAIDLHPTTLEMAADILSSNEE